MPEVRIPSVLQRATGGPGRVLLEADTVGELLTALETTHPGIRDRLLVTDEAGGSRLAAHAHVFVDEDDARSRGGLDAPLAGVGTVTVLPAVAGGADHRRRAPLPASTR